ncbi:hypothetical protein [Ekhidna sp.]|uniref:hypothetical protein n=1 Tax=Ekhidna sp. TaxID=2608089 RepID=UPI0032975851
MSKQLSYQLYHLIKRLTKAEKRHFKLYVKRNSSEKEPIIVKMFDAFDKQNEFDEEKISKVFSDLKPNTLSNHRAHLYEQLLSSIRLLHNDDPSIRIKELISYADVLHNKGLYEQSLIQLSRAKQLASKNKMDILKLEIIELEKKIETRYVTGSTPDRAIELTKESQELRHQFYFSGSWSDLALKLYDYYLKFGPVKGKEQQEQVTSLFIENAPMQENALGGDTIFYYQSYVWYYHIIQNFPLCYKYAKLWCNLFDQNKILLEDEPEMYIRGYHNVLSSLFFCDDVKRFREELRRLEVFVDLRKDSFNENQLIQAFTYLETGKLNLFFLEGKFTEGAKYCDVFENKLKAYESRIDIHRKMVFQYKMASLKFGGGDFHGSLKHLNIIVNNPVSTLKEDIQSYARFLSLIVHYELGNDDLVYFQIKSTYRFMLKLKDFQKVHAAIFKFLRKSIYMDRKSLIPYFKELREELLVVIQDKFERRPMLYLDLVSWLESKIYDRPVEEVIRSKKIDKGA